MRDLKRWLQRLEKSYMQGDDARPLDLNDSSWMTEEDFEHWLRWYEAGMRAKGLGPEEREKRLLQERDARRR